MATIALELKVVTRVLWTFNCPSQFVPFIFDCNIWLVQEVNLLPYKRLT